LILAHLSWTAEANQLVIHLLNLVVALLNRSESDASLGVVFELFALLKLLFDKVELESLSLHYLLQHNLVATH